MRMSFNAVRGYPLFLVALILAIKPVSAQVAEFPYRAMVASANAPVHSGPASVHYATDRLAKGATVLVYRLDPEGWCAIRPPKRSFSLVERKSVRQIDERNGSIVDPRAKAWVGTLLGSVSQPMWQVKLEKDERVEIVGLIEGDSEKPDSSGWFQIKPPAGEFRWIRLRHLSAKDQQRILDLAGTPSLTKPETSDEIDSSNSFAESSTQNAPPNRITIPTVPIPKPNDPVDPFPTETKTNQAEAADSSSIQSPAMQADWKPARKSLDQVLANSGSGFSGQDLDLNSSTNETSGIGVPASPIGYGSSGERVTSIPNESSPSLQSLELALTSEMIKPIELWNLEPLRRQVLNQKSQHVDEASRSGFQHLLDKIERCRKIKAGFPTTGQHPQANRRNGPATGAANSSPRATGTSLSVQPNQIVSGKYDALGILKELVRDGGLSQATYVLLDETGKITHQVKAAPGVNLRRAVGKKIGVIGQRGYNSQSGLGHVTAHRVVELNRFRR